jgi:hypothetical protein
MCHTSHVTRVTSTSSSEQDCSYIIKLGCCKILRKLYEMKSHPVDGAEGKHSPPTAPPHTVVVPVAMVTCAFLVFQPLLDAGYAEDLCAAGLLNDIGE